jgi:hypothetical protein
LLTTKPFLVGKMPSRAMVEFTARSGGRLPWGLPLQNAQLRGAKLPANIRISPTKGLDTGQSPGTIFLEKADFCLKLERL